MTTQSRVMYNFGRSFFFRIQLKDNQSRYNLFILLNADSKTTLINGKRNLCTYIKRIFMSIVFALFVPDVLLSRDFGSNRVGRLDTNDR